MAPPLAKEQQDTLCEEDEEVIFSVISVPDLDFPTGSKQSNKTKVVS